MERRKSQLDTGAILRLRVLRAALCVPAVMGLLPRRAGLFFFPQTFTLTPLTLLGVFIILNPCQRR